MSCKSHFLGILSRHIPTRVCKGTKSLPWMSSDLFKLFRKRDIAFSKFKASRSVSHLSRYKTLRNKSVSALRKAKCDFLKRLSIRSPKQFWSLYHSLTPNRQRIPSTLNDGYVTIESATCKANLLASHVSSCFSQSSHNSNCRCSSSTPCESGLSSVTCTSDEVHNHLCTLKTKAASGPDDLSSHMLQNTASAITSTLTKLFNRSLSTGVVPSEWKLSNITPVFKGKGDPCCVANYSPISLLSLPSKVLERLYIIGY